MATLRPSFLAAPRTIPAFFRCMLCSPWEKLNLVTSTPARTSDPMDSSEEVAGARVEGRTSEGLLYAQELVVLRDALAAGRRACLDLAGIHGHGEVGDRRVLGLPAAVADHRRIAGLVRELHRLEGLRERADLVDLYEDGVSDAIAYAAGEYLRVGHEEVVTDELDPVSQLLGDHSPPITVVFGETVLDAQYGILVAQPHVVVHHLLPGELLTLADKVVLAVLVELGGGRVEREDYLVSQ